ncbi:DUF4139 domain-containing protein [Diaphorobacter sp. HDW4A]|uniref:DUF4139 domain-containing protein n=1 Tax=Diaphorobacter sp. HDW4A TaxID=2714924 RepID=UPI001409AC16|nr:DUF4139 domain-containing protein [Diaphorobacter sp. HDW4A]QIL82099.1 DUF4139 domain-containing protein [Diaphorobacter sp. HDW4A]
MPISSIPRARLARATPLVSAIYACLLAAPIAVLAADSSSSISQVKVYPGSATVERMVRIPAGARSVTIRCLPPNPMLDVQSLQVQADASVRIGETSIKMQDRNLDSQCTTPLDDQVREAEDKVAVAKAETESLQLAVSYLNTVATKSPDEPHSGPGTPGSASINSTTDALRRSSQDVLLKLHQAKRRQEIAELALKHLTNERNRSSGPITGVSTVTITLAAERESDLRLTYQVSGPSWSPNYRATLDSTTNVVKLERMALVAQNTGEDWRNAQLTLSTGQPTRATAGRLPNQWTLDVAQPVTERSRAEYAVATAGAPAPMAVSKAIADAPEMPRFDVQVTQGAYATEFAVPQRITIPSGGQRVTLSLGTHEVRGQLVSRTSPAVEPAAYLVAQLPTLPGVWPTANVALYRDGAYVGQGSLNNNDDELSRVGLSFGRDERIVVTAEPQQQNQGSAGFTGANVERKVQHAYRVENRHQRPVALQVLEAAPVSRNEQIEVKSQYEPAPADKEWSRRPGLILWSETLAPASSQRFVATHTLRYPKEARLQESQ